MRLRVAKWWSRAHRHHGGVITETSMSDDAAQLGTVDVALELSGHPAGVTACLDALDLGGTAVLAGSVAVTAAARAGGRGGGFDSSSIIGCCATAAAGSIVAARSVRRIAAPARVLWNMLGSGRLAWFLVVGESFDPLARARQAKDGPARVADQTSPSNRWSGGKYRR